MFEDLDFGEFDIQTIIISAVMYMIIGIMMWYTLMMKKGVGLRYGILGTIIFYLFLAPITYFIINHFQNK